MSMIRKWAAGLCLLMAVWPNRPLLADDARQAALAQWPARLPRSEAWDKWQLFSGERTPDYDALPSEPFLPDPLRLTDGRPVASAGQWPERRQELWRLFQRYTLGTIPAAPTSVRVSAEESRQEGALKMRSVIIEFGATNSAKLYLEIYEPPAPGPLPVFLVPGNQRQWAILAASRGYVGCAYAACESRDDSLAFRSLWPKADWSMLARRAWAASRAVDYLITQPAVDLTQVVLAAHGLEGKTALITAAFDERIKAVILSSTGVGGACPFRLGSEYQLAEGIEPLTRQHPEWFHPRLRFFAGRENKLPVDQNEMIACIAPRPCLLATALNDPSDSVWGTEQAYTSAQRVYALLNAPTALALARREGGSAIKIEEVERLIDWADSQLGRRAAEPALRRLYPTFADWLQASGENWEPQKYPAMSLQGLLTSTGGNPLTTQEEWADRRKDILERMNWGLGEMPPRPNGSAEDNGVEPAYAAQLMGRAQVPNGVTKRSIAFSCGVPGDVYFPAGADVAGQRLPVVIWLHPFSAATGYMPGYAAGDPVHVALAKAGFAVITFDQIGSGQRVGEIGRFASRYPHSSLLGRTVQEIRAAVDAAGQAAFLNPKRVFVAGYGSGGAAALHAAALDERIAGVISIAGFTPFRLDTADKGTGGIARWSHWLPWLPRLGSFVGQEARAPYDFHEVLAAIAPRPAVVMSPQFGWQSTPADVAEATDAARKVYELLRAEANLALLIYSDYDRFAPSVQELFINQLKAMLQMLDH